MCLRSQGRQESIKCKNNRYYAWKESTYRELHKTKDQHCPKATKIRIWEEPTKKREKKDSSYKVCDYIGWFW